MSRGKRYNGTKQKLNIKKVVAVVIAILVVIMFITVIVNLLKQDTITEKKVATAYYTAYENEKWGVINSTGEVVIEPSYDEMIVIPNKEKAVFIVTYDVDYTEGTYKSKAVNTENEQLFSGYTKVEAIQNHDTQNNIWYETNCLKVQKNGKYGLIDFNGNVLLNCEYDKIEPIIGVENSLLTTKDGKIGVVSTTGSVIIENEYAEITALTSEYENGYIVKNEDSKYGVIGTNKKVLLPIEYDGIKHVYYNNVYVAKTEEKWQIINTSDKSTVKVDYEDFVSINNNHIIVKSSDKYGIIATDGTVEVEPQYQSLKYMYQNYYIAEKDNLFGVIDVSNNEKKIDFTYNNLIYIQSADIIEGESDKIETDLYDRSFNLKLSGIVSEINVDKGYMKVRVNSEYKYYNFKFEECKSKDVLISNTLFLSKKDGKYGYVDKNGVVVINYIYDDATEQNDSGFVAVKKDGKWGAINSKGETVVEPTYELENNAIIDFIGQWHLAEDINANYYTK